MNAIQAIPPRPSRNAGPKKPSICAGPSEPSAFDVHLAKLAQVRGLLIADSGYQPRTSRTPLRQLDDLETRFKDARKNATKELKQTLATRHEQLERAATDLAAIHAGTPTLIQSLTTEKLSAMLLEAIAVFSRLDPESLHDFRKRLKSVRYLSECAADNPDAVQIASTVKSMQTVIGEWHDWEELSIYARDTFRRKTAPELTSELDILLQESLDKAIATCSRITEKILLSSQSASVSTKKPVRRDDKISDRREAVLA